MIEIRAFRRGDGEPLVRLLHAAYGYTYISDSACRYDAAALEDRCLSPLSASVVAFDQESGHLVGHGSWELQEPGRSEGVMFVFDPRSSSPNLGPQLLRPSVELARARGDLLITTHSPTHHDRSQRIAWFAIDMRPTALLLGSYPETLCFRGISPATLPQRESFLYMARLLAAAPEQTAYVIEPHQEFIQGLAARLGLAVQFRSAPAVPDGAGPSDVRAQVNPYWLSGSIAFRRIGGDAREILEARSRTMLEGCLRHIDLILPLADPLTPALSAQAESLGFFPAGIMPRPDGLVWAMQRLQHQRLDPAALQLLDAEADAIRNYIAARVPAEALKPAAPRELVNAGALELDLDGLRPHIDQAFRRARRHGRQAAILRLAVPAPGGADHRQRRAQRRRLEELARELGSALRATDLKAQIDGQSILVLLPEVQSEALAAIRGRLGSSARLNWKEGPVAVDLQELSAIGPQA